MLTIHIQTSTHHIVHATDIGITKAAIAIAKALDLNRYTHSNGERTATVEKRGEMGRVWVVKKPCGSGRAYN